MMRAIVIRLRPLSPLTLLLALACSSGDQEPSTDAGRSPSDASTAADAGAPSDAETFPDAEVYADAETFPDAITYPDAETFPDAEPDAGEADSGEPAIFTLTSATVVEGGTIPADHACPEPDLQPELSWTNAPAGTMSYVLVLIDDSIDFVHWVAYNIPAATTSLPQGASDNNQLPAGAQEANAYCRRYCGPCPGSRHTYTFRVYALDVATINFNRSGAFGDAELTASLGANTLGMATLTANYTP